MHQRGQQRRHLRRRDFFGRICCGREESPFGARTAPLSDGMSGSDARERPPGVHLPLWKRPVP
jgi:hypothetical protein